jgi:hypothetical protein
MSGFKQDPNQLNPAFYRVVLTLSAGTANWTRAAPANGAVYPQDHSVFLTKPSTDANALKVARGHLRFMAIIEEVSKFADVQILDVEFTSANKTVADNQPTEVRFTVRYDRDANVVSTLLGTTFSTTSGVVTVDSVAKSIRYLVGSAIARNNYTKRVRVWQPTIAGESDTAVTVDTPDILANIYNDIAVIAIDGTSI